MPWYLYLGGAITLYGVILTVAMFLPLRIFMRYLRKNREDHTTLTAKFGILEFQTLITREGGHMNATLYVKAARLSLRVPVIRTERKGRKTAAIKIRRWELGLPPPDLATLKKLPDLFRRSRRVLKKMSWREFKMEMVFGADDPALTGMAVGGGWVVGGMLPGLLQQHFRLDTVPQVNILPCFDGPAFQVRYEGEVAMPLFRWLKLLLIMKSIGGATSGESSH
jgi:hypothetical protein